MNKIGIKYLTKKTHFCFYTDLEFFVVGYVDKNLRCVTLVTESIGLAPLQCVFVRIIKITNTIATQTINYELTIF